MPLMKFEARSGGGSSLASVKVGQALQQLLEEHAQLEAGQARAQAEVRAEAEGEMVVRRALDIEGERIGEDRGVAVRGRVEEQQLALPLAMRWPRSSTSRVAVRAMFWIGVTQRSISSTAVGIFVGSALRRAALLGMPQQLVHAAADDVPRRLVAADQDQQRFHQQLVVVEPHPVDLGVDEDADQIVLRLLTGGRRAPAIGSRGTRGTRPARVPASPGSVLPLEPSISSDHSSRSRVGVRVDPEHVADDDERQPRGDVLDEVEAAARLGALDEIDADLADARLALGDAPRREPLVHQRAALLVERVVEVDHVRHRRRVGAHALPRCRTSAGRARPRAHRRSG